MPPTQTRLVGSGFTTFHIMGKAIAFLDEVHDSGQAPIRQYEAVTPLGDYFPREFALPRVKAEGQLQFIIREMWNLPVWWQIALFANTYNIIDIYNLQAGLASPITASTIIKKPFGMSGANAKPRGWTYANVNLIQIDDREVVQIGALTMPRTLTAIYANKLYFPSPGYVLGQSTPMPTGNQAGPIGQFASTTTAASTTIEPPAGSGGY